jgi:hypothetical protein
MRLEKSSVNVEVDSKKKGYYPQIPHPHPAEKLNNYIRGGKKMIETHADIRFNEQSFDRSCILISLSGHKVRIFSMFVRC